ncbi:MAG: TIGR02206 family membrane protein [Saprospiraceae bacterium]|jgi:hypothetical integral membrane protein (TIGR02206 family)|nr:TIGR02206 family membrane protein [Saprospiraceae bacterium]MBL0027120.1 TIGR02206 family membrane protein [Saprospiraceae bacterium]
MLDLFLKDNGGFTNYSWEHGFSFIACIFFIIIALYYGRNKWNGSEKILYITIICTFGACTQLFKVGYKYYAGIFDPTNDIPLHLCNIMTLIMPFIMWFRWRALWGISFFWIVAGCAQALFTPTLTESLPHYEAVRYWAVHAVIILGAFYGWYVFGFKPTISDAIKSAIGMNVLAAILYPINVSLGSNYMYLNKKPPGKTFYDLLGPWPDYILSLEVMLVVLFSIILIPFYWHKIRPVFEIIKT